jgi:hypothetical protein
MSHRVIGCLIVLLAIAGCSRQETVSCNTDTRYSTARSAPPVQIPDDLSPPNESDALRLPPLATVGSDSAVGPCLQSPPSFFGDSRPFRRDADAPEAPPAESTAPPVPAGDRVIDN